MDIIYAVIFLILEMAIIILPVLGIIFLLEKLSQKFHPHIQRFGDRLGMILSKKRREYIESLNIEEGLKENFCMPIDEVVTIAGVGTVVVGTVESGVCREGEQAYLEQDDGRIEITLGHIDLETRLRKSDGKAYRTEHIAVLLIGVTEEQVKVGSRIIVENRELLYNQKEFIL